MGKKIHIGIRYRVLLIFLAVSVLVVVGMFIATSLSFEWGISRYALAREKERLTALADILEENYAQSGSWDFLFQKETRWEKLSLSTRPNSGPRQGYGMGMGRRRGHHGSDTWEAENSLIKGMLSFEKRIILRDTVGKLLFGPDLEERRFFSIPLEMEEGKIGKLSLIPPKSLVDRAMQQFASGQRRTLVFVALGIAALAALFAFPLTGRFVRRITGLAAATNQLASGSYDIRVPENSSDELGQLAADFNRLAQTLEKNEELRRQWVADISHELRTPLSVLRGEVESVQDGIRKMSPELLGRIHAETLHLTRLVNDLYEISLADIGALTYHRSMLNFGELLCQVLHSHDKEASERGLKLIYKDDGKPAMLFGDAERLRQLFNNLLQNSLRYTDSGGRILVRLSADGRKIVLSILDSPPGVPDKALSHLFDRLYRVDGSRNRARGGAGLGLSMCKSIVEAHNGVIEARHSNLGGLEIRIVLGGGNKHARDFDYGR